MSDLMQAAAGGWQMGQAIDDTKRQRGLAGLAAQAYRAEGPQRSSLLAQMVELDPNAGLAMHDKLQTQDDTRAKKALGAARYMLGAFDTKDDAQIQGAYQAVRPFFQQLAPDKVLPDRADDTMLPMLHQVIAASGGEGGGGNVQSTYINADGQRVAIMRDGSQKVLGDANPSIRVLEQEGALPYGVVTSGGRAGSVVPLGSGQARTTTIPQGPDVQAHADVVASAAEQMRKAGVPDQQIEAWIVQATGGQVSDAPVTAPVGPVRTPTSAERAAAEERAKLGVRAQMEPMIAGSVEGAKVDANLARAGAVAGAEADAAREKKEAEAEAERNAAVAKRTQDAQAMIGLLDEAEQLLPNATGGVFEAGRDTVAGYFGHATEGSKATARLNLIAAQLVAKVPRFEGPQSNIDVQFYKDAAGDLNNPNLPVERRMAALQTMRKLAQKAAGAPSASGGQPRRVTNAADYDALPSGALYIAPDGSQRRKR